MILIDQQSKAVFQILLNRVRAKFEKSQELDFHLVEYSDVRYHIQSAAKEGCHLTLSLGLPSASPDLLFSGDLPVGAIDAVTGSYGPVVQIVEPPEDGFNLTLRIDLRKLPVDEETADCLQMLTKLASVRAIVLGAPFRNILRNLSTNTVAAEGGELVALMHRPEESIFLVQQTDQVTVIFPMHFKEPTDVTLATSFLQEFMETRRTTPGLSNAPPCLWSPTPPLELKGLAADEVAANCGFVSFVIFSRHVEGEKLDSTVWNLSTFHAYVGYHVKCSKAFMHTRMRRQVETLIQVLNRAKPDIEKERKTAHGRSFKRFVDFYKSYVT